MAQPVLSDALWELIEPLLPPPRSYPKGGRPPLGNRECLTGILFILKTGIPWEQLPQEMGCGSGMTCWRRLRDWNEAGVWRKLHQVLLDELNAASAIDWSRAALDASSVPAKKGATRPARIRRIVANRAQSTMCW